MKFKRKHKTLKEAQKELEKIKPNFEEYKIYFKRTARIWKYIIANDIEWLHELY